MAILNRLSAIPTLLRFGSFFASRCGISGDCRAAILEIVRFAILVGVSSGNTIRGNRTERF